MPYTQVNLPFRGISIDSGFSSILPGFTSDSVNVVPYDAFKGKLRIGQRRGLLAALKFNSGGTTRQIQAIVRADAYVAGVLTQRCIVVAGGQVFIIDPGDTSPTMASQALTRKLKTTGYIGCAVFGQFIYFTDGLCYRKMDITVAKASASVVAWAGPENDVRATGATTNGNNETGNRAPLLCRFGGRLALAGIPESANNWFLCHINNPEDWTTAAASPHDAIAGSTSNRFGVPGEPISALIPVGESGLIFAGKHTMNYLTADPIITDARIIDLSRSVGIVGPRAWCASDEQTIYLMSQDGLYRVRPNEFQITKSGRVTSGRLDTFFQQQQFEDLNCSLGYDAESQNVMCFMSRTDIPSSSVHLLYNQPTDAIWPWKSGWSLFAAPTCCGEFPLGDARAPILAIGGDASASAGGYIGWFDRDLTTGIDGLEANGYKGVLPSPDANTARTQRIVSRLTIGPVLQPSLDQVMLKDIRVELTMDAPKEDTTYQAVVDGPYIDVLSGQTAEEAIGENIVSVTASYVAGFPLVVLDGGSHANFTADPLDTPTNPYDGGQQTGGALVQSNSVDLLYETEIAGTYTTPDALITDPTVRTYFKSNNRIYNTDAVGIDWFIQHQETPTSNSMYRRDESLPDTSADAPGGTYRFLSEDMYQNGTTLPTLPAGVFAPRLSVTGATYDNTNSMRLGTLVPGRNDSIRCRIRDQAIYMRISSNGVPWAIERMAVNIEGRGHTKNVKGTY